MTDPKLQMPAEASVVAGRAGRASHAVRVARAGSGDPAALTARLVALLQTGFPEHRWDVESVRSRVLTPGEWCATFEAVRDEEPIGAISLHRPPGTAWAKLHWPAVAPAARRCGVATALMAAAAQEAAAPGCAEVFLRTEADKADAIRLYRDLGFVVEDPSSSGGGPT